MVYRGSSLIYLIELFSLYKITILVFAVVNMFCIGIKNTPKIILFEIQYNYKVINAFGHVVF